MILSIIIIVGQNLFWHELFLHIIAILYSCAIYICYRYNGYLPQGDRGRRRSKFVLYKRSEPSGVKRSKHYIVQSPQTSKAILDANQHSISYTLSRNQAVIVEYKEDAETDMFQVRIFSLNVDSLGRFLYILLYILGRTFLRVTNRLCSYGHSTRWQKRRQSYAEHYIAVCLSNFSKSLWDCQGQDICCWLRFE